MVKSDRSEQWLYHATPSKNIPHIKANGLLPHIDDTLYFSLNARFCQDWSINRQGPADIDPVRLKEAERLGFAHHEENPVDWTILKVRAVDALRHCKLEYHGKRSGQDPEEIRANDDWSADFNELLEECVEPECGPCIIPWALIEIAKECPYRKGNN